MDRNRKGTVTVGKDGKVTFTAADDRTCIATYYPVTTTSNGFAAPLRENLCARLGRAGDEWIRLN